MRASVISAKAVMTTQHRTSLLSFIMQPVPMHYYAVFAGVKTSCSSFNTFVIAEARIKSWLR